ncbi:unnamed protein product [Ectocarpus sp. 12 AP-2014]
MHTARMRLHPDPEAKLSLLLSHVFALNALLAHLRHYCTLSQNWTMLQHAPISTLREIVSFSVYNTSTRLNYQRREKCSTTAGNAIYAQILGKSPKIWCASHEHSIITSRPLRRDSDQVETHPN